MSLVAGRDINELLAALGEELALLGAAPIELCLIGGSALALLGLVERPTKDIDVVALAESRGGVLRVRRASPLPDVLVRACAEVATQQGIDPNWLNSGPARLLDWGLPDGFETRLVSRDYGSRLVIHLASRLDQICFKTYAAADVAGRHLSDLQTLSPTGEEMRFAFAWVIRQDPSPGFHTQLEQMADYLGVRDVLDTIEY